MTTFFDDKANFSGRVALGVSYNGADYFGWQIQKKPAVNTIQGELEKAISKVANEPILTHCAGRTDARVHGTSQVVHFDTMALRTEKAWVRGVNANLPDSISISWARSVSDDFHARFSAVSRTYQYIILNRSVRAPELVDRAVLYDRPLNEILMNEAGALLLGEHDFSAYRGAGCQSNSPNRFVESIQVSRLGDLVITEITANAFLLHMVRNIMGVLMAIGAGDQPVKWAGEVLASRDRKQAGVTAKPEGLYLVGVKYPEDTGIPQALTKPAFLP